MPRTAFANMSERMEGVNRHISDFSETHGIPRNHFVSVPTSVHPVVKSATRKLHILAPFIEAFVNDLFTVMRSHGWPDGRNNFYGSRCNVQLRYPVIWNQDKTACIAFPNISLTNFNISMGTRQLRSENPWFPKVSSTLVDRILDDLQDDKRRMAWTPTSRGIKRLNQRQEMSVSRVLARAVMCNGDDITDAQYIDNISQHIIELNEPATFVLADTVDDFRLMYSRNSTETPSSCMDSRHSFALSGDHRPVDFYGQCPVTRGAYIKRGSVTLARAVLWRDSKTDKWAYSRIYSSRSANTSELINHLNKQGIKSVEDTRIHARCEFDVPAVQYNGCTVCPMPYFDLKPFPWLGVKLSDDGSTFRVKMGDSKDDRTGWQLPSLTSTSGSHTHTMYTECCQCGSNIDTDNDDDYHNVSGDAYCSVTCAIDNYAVVYLTSNDWELRYRRDVPADAIPAWTPHVFYSNRHAALHRQDRYHPVPWADTEGDLFVYFHNDDINNRGAQFWHRQEMEVGKKHYAMQVMYVSGAFNFRGNPQCLQNANWQHEVNDQFQFLSIPVANGKTVPSNLKTVTAPFAVMDSEQSFSDDMFDEHIHGILNEPAPLADYVQLA